MAQLKAGTTIDGRVVMKEFDDLITRIGNNEDLNTTQKATLILAINEVFTNVNNHKQEFEQYKSDFEYTFNKRIIERGSSIDGDERHFYEIYADGTGKAWGVRHIKNLLVSFDFGPFRRTGTNYGTNKIISFSEVHSANLRATSSNFDETGYCWAMTSNNEERTQCRFVFEGNPAEAEVYLDYVIEGVVDV